MRLRMTAVLTCALPILLTANSSALSAGEQSPTKGDVAEAATPLGSANVKVVSYNLCGAKCSIRGEIPDRTGYLMDEVLNFDADVVMLTEVCYLQYRHIRDELDTHGYDAAWVANRAKVDDCTPPGGDTEELAAQNLLRFGRVIVAKNALAGREEIILTPTNFGTRSVSKALCYDVNIAGLGQGAVRGCVGHLRPGATGPPARARWAQAATFAAEVDKYLFGSNQQAVILGGDFNAQPGDTELDVIYERDGVGAFVEADMTDSTFFTAECLNEQATHCRSGAPTFVHPTAGPKKIDYIFFSKDHASNLQGEIRPIGPNSDHHLLRGSATISVN